MSDPPSGATAMWQTASPASTGPPKRHERRLTGAAERLHGAGVFERRVERVELGCALSHEGELGGRDVAREAQLTAGEDVIRGAGREDARCPIAWPSESAVYPPGPGTAPSVARGRDAR